MKSSGVKKPRGARSPESARTAAVKAVKRWFRQRGWKPFAFQQEVWDAYLNGESGLLYASTGAGKTYAVWFAALIDELTRRALNPAPRESKLKVLWITPLRALAADTQQALLAPLHELGIDWTIETRTGDTAPSIRRKQQKRLPQALITTPESLSLMLTRKDASELFSDLRMVVVDEWHELLSTKRGVQVELALARIQRWTQGLRVWGVSATLGNLEEAAQTLVQPVDALRPPRLVRGMFEKVTRIESLLPPDIQRFPWGGHLGLKLLPQLIPLLEKSSSTLLFTNTRSQAEIWYQAILKARPDWAGELGLHHGSLDRSTREWVERGLKAGVLRCVVCTSSLDLGVDFTPVEQVVQVGSPKGIARLLQRAGRSGHQPGAVSRLVFVPTNALELIELSAARDAAAESRLEGREPIDDRIDVLVQHAVTIAAGPGFTADELYDEIRSTHAFRDLKRDDWDWILDFVTHGGETLKAYPDFHRVAVRENQFQIASERISRQHKAQIGTICGDAQLRVKFLHGPRLGSIEESFVAKLKPGDCFTFAGRCLELVKVHEMDVLVRAGSRKNGVIPRWMGGRMPLSSQLAEAMREKLDDAGRGVFEGPEMESIRPLLEVQGRWSKIPARNELLVERYHDREGDHLFIYPFAGRLVHEGLASLWAWRLSRALPNTFSMSFNDYGMELLSPHAAALDGDLAPLLFHAENLSVDLAESLNSVEMARRQFREVARVAGLVFEGYAGNRKTAKQLQASSGLLFDVFTNYDPQNRLVKQARREVMERQFEHVRLRTTLERLSKCDVVIQHLQRPTPLAFPLMVERFRERLSNESLTQRIQRLTAQLEKAADREK